MHRHSWAVAVAAAAGLTLLRKAAVRVSSDRAANTSAGMGLHCKVDGGLD